MGLVAASTAAVSACSELRCFGGLRLACSGWCLGLGCVGASAGGFRGRRPPRWRRRLGGSLRRRLQLRPGGRACLLAPLRAFRFRSDLH
eukprot:13563323-Alexandrium_andersonii.AAC.1